MARRCSCRGAIALLAALLSSLALGAPAARSAVPPVDAAPPAARGELLYAIHCIECHNARIHWRDHGLVRDWPTLEAQVDRWQRAAQLGWSRDDIREVTHYLGERVYGFAPRQRRAVGSAGPSAP
jgi:mono/diheme cytochrome c family protein